MTIEQQLDELAGLEYPKKVDVVDRVMAEVEQKPYLRPVHRFNHWQRIGTIAAAAVVALVAVNVVLFNTGSLNNDGTGSMVSQVDDYSSWNTVEAVADSSKTTSAIDEAHTN